jgi:uncharacterized protein (TIGR00369 family)
MQADTHYKRLESLYLSANVNKLFTNLTINISDSSARISIKTTKDLFHAANALHGMTYFKLLDDAAFFASNSLVTDVFVLTSNFNIQLLRPVTSGILVAEGKVVFKSKNTIIADSVLFNDGKMVGKGTGSFMKSNIILNDLQVPE